MVQTLLPVTFGYFLSSDAVIMRQLRRWKRLWRRSLTRPHKKTAMGPSRSCWNSTTSALQPEEFTLKGTRVSCVYYQEKCPYKKNLETYLMIHVYIYIYIYRYVCKIFFFWCWSKERKSKYFKYFKNEKLYNISNIKDYLGWYNQQDRSDDISWERLREEKEEKKQWPLYDLYMTSIQTDTKPEKLSTNKPPRVSSSLIGFLIHAALSYIFSDESSKLETYTYVRMKSIILKIYSLWKIYIKILWYVQNLKNGFKKPIDFKIL